LKRFVIHRAKLNVTANKIQPVYSDCFGDAWMLFEAEVIFIIWLWYKKWF